MSGFERRYWSSTVMTRIFREFLVFFSDNEFRARRMPCVTVMGHVVLRCRDTQKRVFEPGVRTLCPSPFAD